MKAVVYDAARSYAVQEIPTRANPKGYGSNFPGFFAEYVTVPETLVFSVDGLPKAVA